MMKRRNIFIPDDVWAALSKRAKIEGRRSTSNLIVRLLQQEIERMTKQEVKK